MAEFAEKSQRIAENMERITRIHPKQQRFKSQEDIPNELRDDFLYLEVI